MTVNEPLRRWLRTPRGVLGLIAASLAATAAAAAVLASQRAWFESKARETYAEPSAAIDALGRELDSSQAAGRVRALPAADKGRLYTDWMQAGDAWPEAAPAAMAAADPSFYLDRSLQTLLAGSRAQRARAAAFLARSGAPGARALLAEAAARARRRRESELAHGIEAEIAVLAAPR